jgi:glycosyltransferase involved in cell wall biosynthesis
MLTRVVGLLWHIAIDPSARCTPLRIAMLSSQFPPLWGGVGVVAHGQVVNLAARGHEVHVITRRHPPGASVPTIEGDVHVHHVPIAPLPMAFTTSFGKHAVAKVKELGNDFDVVHNHCNMSLLDRSAYDEIGAPVVNTMHGTWAGERSMITWRDVTPSVESANDLAVLYLSPIFDVYEDYALKYSDAALIISDNELRADRARGVRNVHGDDRWIRLSAGFDANGFRPENADPAVLERHGADPDRPTVLFVGRLAARKGVFDMVDIFDRARMTYPEAQLVVVGSGPQERTLVTKIKRLGLEDVVTMTGSITFPDLQAMYATCHVVLYPSFWEGQGLIVGEAWASGTPIIAAEVGWVPEVVRQGENGFSHPVRDVKKAVTQLEVLLSDDGLRHKLGEAGRQEVLDHHTWSHHVDRLEEVYGIVMEDGRAPEG